MIQRSKWLRATALVGVLALAVTACGGGSETTTTEATGATQATEPPEATTTTAAPEETTTTAAPGSTTTTLPPLDIARPERDDVLDFGYVLPETGPLAFLGAPQFAGVDLAIADVNAAGGVLGADVTIQGADAAGQAAVARQATARHINDGVDVILGAAASGISNEIIQLTHDNEIVQCSGSNTSPVFTDQENNDFYFRTVPPDQAVAPIIAQRVLEDGYTNVAVVGRADDYGVALVSLIVEGLESSGATIAVNETYDPNTTDFSSLVTEIVDSGADAAVIIGFGEAATLVRQLAEAGFPTNAMYAGDGMFGPPLWDDVGVPIPGFTVIGASGGTEFNQRLNEAMAPEEQGNVIYGAQFYDCVVISALAAIAADSTDPVVFIDKVQAVTKDGTKCTTFEECKGLIESGEDIDYDGVSGPINLNGTDPTFGRYAIAVFQEDSSLEVVDSVDVDLSQVG